MKRMILGWLAAGILAVPMSAQALLVTVDGQAYDVKTINGTFNEFRTALVAQPFWLNSQRAKDLAAATKDSFGLPLLGRGGPAFGYLNFTTALGDDLVRFWFWNGTSGPAATTSIATTEPWVWATATPVPLPPALYLLGLGLAGLLGLGKRRRTQATPI